MDRNTAVAHPSTGARGTHTTAADPWVANPNPVWSFDWRTSLGVVNDSVLVGRDNDLAAVTDLLESGGHRARLVLLEGEAGIGKTSLADGLASAAEARGVEVRWGAGAGDEDAPPYWLWRQLVPDVVSDGDRFELVARLHDALEGARLLVIDDLQLVDESSISVLAQLLRSRWAAAPAVLATRRTGDRDEAWRARVAPLLDGVDLHVWIVSGIGRESVPSLCEAVGVDLTATTMNSLYADSRGNPLVLRELVAANADGAPRTERYAALVRERVRRLSSRAQTLASAAAVVGDPFDLAVTARVCRRGVEASLGAADELVSSGIWRLLPERPGFLAFGHGLTRDAILDGLSLQKRVSLHRNAAKVLESLSGDDPSRAAELAGHWVAASVTGEREPALRWSAIAAEQALEAGAWEDAVRLASRVLDRTATDHPTLSEVPLLTTRARATFLLGAARRRRSRCPTGPSRRPGGRTGRPRDHRCTGPRSGGDPPVGHWPCDPPRRSACRAAARRRRPPGESPREMGPDGGLSQGIRAGR